MYKNGEECPICSEGTLSKSVIDEEFEYKGHKKVVHDYEIYKCNCCNEVIVSNESIRNSEKIIRDFQRSVDDLLTSEEIKKGRVSLGFTQEAFADILGVGSKNFARYENGSVTQSRSMDNLLRILYEMPAALNVIDRKLHVYRVPSRFKYTTHSADNDVRYAYKNMQNLMVVNDEKLYV